MANAPHIPVLIRSIIESAAPIHGTWVDGTFGAGGYTKELLRAGADRVIGFDRDANVLPFVQAVTDEFPDQFYFVQKRFSQMGDLPEKVDGVVLDLGVSSMQLDQAERGFSFQKDGPLDMRMGNDGPTAADIANTATAEYLADILYIYGEERASKRIARAIVREREMQPFETTLQLAAVIESCLPRPKPNQSHPATRSFQGLRIMVNEEYQELAMGLSAAEQILHQGGVLAVVSFHSIEDRIVKRFMQTRAGSQQGSRYAPAVNIESGPFEIRQRKAIAAPDDEVAANPRARSAKLRLAWRTDAPIRKLEHKEINVPMMPQARKS